MMASERDNLEATSRPLRFSWHKHTRFKMPSANRQVKTQTSSYVIDRTHQPNGSQAKQLLSTKTRILVTCCALLLMAPCQPARAQASRAMADSATRPSMAVTTSAEVELVASSTNGPINRRQSRVYKIRAAPINGKLAVPNPRAHQMTERVIAQLLPAANQTEQQTVGFGLRAFSKQTPVAATKEAADCPESANIAASSPTLRLMGNARQAVSRAPEPQLIAETKTSRLAAFQTQESLLEAASQSDAPGESILSLIDDYDSKIITNRTKAQLSCDSGEMILRLNFSEPFKGIVYPDHNRLSPCRFFGDGHLNYELRLPLRGCGTRQAAPRVFVNDVIVRFHKSLELEEDEVKTLICRYPPPSSMQAGSSLAGKFSGALEQESLPPFELVDPLSGRPARGQPGSAQEPGSTGNIETLSENLVVAPAQGNFLGVPGQSADSARHSDYTTPIGRLVQPTDTMAPPVGGSFLERLSTIELLFLISSLMFLALLALGLVAGYYFVRRRESSSRHASAILRRKRRFLGPNQHLGGAQATLHAAGPAVVHQYQRQAPSSSPDDSDLSGRGLLGGQQQRLVPMQPYYFNLAYAAPELGPHRQPYAAQFAGHAHALGRRQQPGPAELQVQGRRLEQHQQAAHSMGRRQLKRAKLAAGEPTLLQFAQPAPPADSSHTFGKARAVPAYAMDDAVGGALWRAKSLSNVDTEPRPNRLVGGTLSRHELRQQAEASWRHQLLETLARPHSQRFHHHQHHRVPPDGDEQQQNRTGNQKPRLLLKSIEDSYITKVSEVCEQEYMKRDSTRPLSLTEWRSLIQQQQPQPDNKTINGSSEDEQEDNKRQSTNLRSLTELDVNFAKTLRQSSTGTTGDELLLQLEQKEPPPPAATTTDKQSESPDLILSPEYDYDRLELEPNKASSSRNSVSYA